MTGPLKKGLLKDWKITFQTCHPLGFPSPFSGALHDAQILPSKPCHPLKVPWCVTAAIVTWWLRVWMGLRCRNSFFFSLAVRLGSHFMHIFQPGKPVDCFGTAGDSSRKVLDPQRWLRRDTCKETARSDARLSAAHILTGKVSHQLRAGQKKVSEPAFSYELLQNCCTF